MINVLNSTLTGPGSSHLQGLSFVLLGKSIYCKKKSISLTRLFHLGKVLNTSNSLILRTLGGGVAE